MKIVLMCISLCLIAACTPTPGSETTPATPSDSSTPASGEKVSFSTAQAIIQNRCATCHAASPTQPGVNSASAGIKLESANEIKAQINQIQKTAVNSTRMPASSNVTQMTSEERKTLGRWIEQGAPTS